MAQKYTTKSQETIFDIAINSGIGIENIISFAIKNNLASLNDKFQANQNLEYDTPDITVINSNITNQNSSVSIYNSRQGQTIYDIAIMLNGTLENIVQFVLGSPLVSINDAINSQVQFSYNTSGNAITKWINKNGYIFKTGNTITIDTTSYPFLLTEDGYVIATENGFGLTIEE